jgi:hypothetical protein
MASINRSRKNRHNQNNHNNNNNNNNQHNKNNRNINRNLFNTRINNTNRRSNALSRKRTNASNKMHNYYLKKSYGYTKPIITTYLSTKLSDNSQFWWSFLKSNDKLKDAIRSKHFEINSMFPKMYTFGNNFRDYIYNYINKPCKIFINFDENREGKYFTNLFINTLNGIERERDEQQIIANFLFSEFEGKTDFLICDDNSNVLFYKVDELKLMLDITNKYFEIPITMSDIKRIMCQYISPENLNSNVDPYIHSNFYYIIMLFGSTLQCNMKNLNLKNLNNFQENININMEDLPQRIKDKKISLQSKQRLGVLKQIYDEYIQHFTPKNKELN